MLADQYTTILNQFISAFFFCCLIIPGTCKGNFHSNGRAYRTRTQEERCITGNNFCVSISTNITHLSLVFCNITICNHFIDLHTCCDTSQITSIIDRCECIVIIVQILCMSLSTCCMAELDIRIFLSCLNYIILMTKAVCKDKITSRISKFTSCFITFLAFRNICLSHALHTKLLTCLFCSIHKVQIISRVLIVQENKTCL